MSFLTNPQFRAGWGRILDERQTNVATTLRSAVHVGPCVAAIFITLLGWWYAGGTNRTSDSADTAP